MMSREGTLMTAWGAMLGAALLVLAAAGALAGPLPVAGIAGLEEHALATRELPGWRKPERVVVFLPEGEFGDKREALAQLRGIAPGAEFIAIDDPADLPGKIAGADVLLGICSPAVVAAGTELRWIQHYYVGVDRCVGAPGLKERNILLSNSRHLSGPPIAEHVLALLLGLSRNMPRLYRAQMAGDWRWEYGEGAWELGGKTMLVVGLGGIGTEVAARAHALGMRVIATRGSSREGPDYVDYVGLADELPTLAAEADVVVNCAPLTPATTGIFDRAFFRRMKSSAYFLSIGRGASTVTADLVAALEAGEIAGAGLDVVDPEPLPANSPLWKMENVIITPHVAAGSDLLGTRVWELVRENLRRYVAGEPLLNVVDIERGY